MSQQVLKVQQMGDALEFEGADTSFIKNYFRLDDDLPKITSEISRDRIIKQAIQTFHGLRIARQNPWECLISYICATYKNIPAIKQMILELSKRFGDKTVFDNYDFYTFPKPDALTEASHNELDRCKLGFRAKWVLEVAKLVDSNRVDFEELKKASYEEAKGELLKLPGIGNKVADCVLLFSLDKLEAFPVDVWMRRVVQEHYATHFEASFIDKLSRSTTLSSKDYRRIGSFARDYFGSFAGYAQEYLFHFVRSKVAKVSI